MMNTVDSLALVFKALSDATRLRIVHLLISAGELCVCDIERVLAVPQARASRHLAFLRNAGLVNVRREGQWMHYSLRRDTPIFKSVCRALAKESEGNPALVKDMATLRRHTPVCCTAPDAMGA